MSDVPQGPGWWRASDGRYYPPEARPSSGAAGDTSEQEQHSQEQHRGARPDEAVVEEGAPVDQSAAGEPTLFDLPPLDPTPQEPTRQTVIDESLYERDWGVEDEAEPEGRRLWPILVIVAIIGLIAGVAIWFVLDGSDESDTATPAETTSTTGPTTTDDPDGSENPTQSTTPDTGVVSPFALEVGNCLNAGEVDDGGDLLVNVELIDCDDAHQAEVVSVEDMEAAGNTEFPGKEAVDARAKLLCQPRVESFIGGSLVESSLLLLWLTPTEESWADDNDREVVCMVAAPDGETLTGSAAGMLASDDASDAPDGEG